MREIKFRGRSKLNAKWAYGSLIPRGEDWCSIIVNSPEYGDLDNNEVRVITKTVNQYTGLKDKNGKEIYEGDIYLAERSYMPSRGHKRKGYPDRIKVICVVEWSVYDAGWRAKEISPIKEHIEYDNNAPYHYYHTSLSGAPNGNADWVEVIGNIYETPELITPEKPTQYRLDH